MLKYTNCCQSSCTVVHPWFTVLKIGLNHSCFVIVAGDVAEEDEEDRETSQTDGDNTFAWPTHSTYDEQRWSESFCLKILLELRRICGFNFPYFLRINYLTQICHKFYPLTPPLHNAYVYVLPKRLHLLPHHNILSDPLPRSSLDIIYELSRICITQVYFQYVSAGNPWKIFTLVTKWMQQLPFLCITKCTEHTVDV